MLLYGRNAEIDEFIQKDKDLPPMMCQRFLNNKIENELYNRNYFPKSICKHCYNVYENNYIYYNNVYK